MTKKLTIGEQKCVYLNKLNPYIVYTQTTTYNLLKKKAATIDFAELYQFRQCCEVVFKV